MIRIVLFGSSGKMGKSLQERASAFNVEVVTDPADAHVLIDFSHPDALNANIETALRYERPLLVGTTGLTPAHKECLTKAATKIPVLWSRNMSFAICVMGDLVARAAALLGPSFDIEIMETHHRDKVDAPSGTALSLAEQAAKGRGVSYPDCLKIDGRQGARSPNSIGVAVSRGGGVIGEHTVRFISDTESLELTHRGFSRSLFADGALTAACWLSHQSAGLYHIADMNASV